MDVFSINIVVCKKLKLQSSVIHYVIKNYVEPNYDNP
jgi:hypothetical protein